MQNFTHPFSPRMYILDFLRCNLELKDLEWSFSYLSEWKWENLYFSRASSLSQEFSVKTKERRERTKNLNITDNTLEAEIHKSNKGQNFKRSFGDEFQHVGKWNTFMLSISNLETYFINRNFFFCGVGLTSPGTAATSGLLYSPRW
jgi:hypothetical protein